MDDDSWHTGDGKNGEWGRAALLSALILGSVLWPLRQNWRPMDERVDGFPLSYYPMFSARRPRRCGITYVVAVRADGTRRYLPDPVLGPGGLNQVRRQLYRVAVREGRAQDYATALAARLGAREGYADIERVDLVRGCFDLDQCMLGHSVTATEVVLASAPVPHPRATSDGRPVVTAVPS